LLYTDDFNDCDWGIGEQVSLFIKANAAAVLRKKKQFIFLTKSFEMWH
jgi:hypothetical protein